MLTRRELLTSMAGVPLVQILSEKQAYPGVQFYQEPHALAEESARGFRSFCQERSGTSSSPIIIAPAVCSVRPQTCAELLESVRKGAWLLFESGVCFSANEECLHQARILKQMFGLEIQPPIRIADLPSASSSYISYVKPLANLVRSFYAVTPVRCFESEILARFHGHTVCATKRIGKGRLIYLGSMLGTGLLAEEREAWEVAEGLTRFLSWDNSISLK